MTGPEPGVQPEPDTKDWTWVLERPCPECGFDAAAVDPADVGDLLRVNADDWADLLTEPHALVTARPAPTTWSAVEYAAHVRDVCEVYAERLHRMLTEDGPRYANWDQDATAIAKRYDLQQPADVLRDLRLRAAELADAFDEVEGAAWDRTGHRSDGADFTIRSFARYFIHDPVHHVHDVRRGLAQLRSAGVVT